MINILSAGETADEKAPAREGLWRIFVSLRHGIEALNTGPFLLCSPLGSRGSAWHSGERDRMCGVQ